MSYWAAARLIPQRERLALHCLALRGYEVYVPRIRVRKAQHIARAGFHRQGTPPPALFPGYAFILVSLQWSHANYCPGVLRLIFNGDQPARVPDVVINDIRSRERGGLVDLPKGTPSDSGLNPGDRVRVRSGPLAGFYGLHVAMKPHERVAVLLQLLGGQREVELARKDVTPA